MTPLQTGATAVVDALAAASVRIAGVAALATLVAAAVALVYRWLVRQQVPPGVPLLLGLSAVVLYLNARSALGDVVGGELDLLALNAVAFNVTALVVAAAASPVGRAVGDRIAVDIFAFTGARELDADVSALVRTVGRVITVSLPDEVDDMDEHDPVPEEVKADVAGKTLVFPRGLTVEELRGRLRSRLKDDYGVGYVDLEIDDEGTVTYLALGARVAGIGPTLAPGTAAVAVRADPPNAASPGDVVQVWRPGETPERVTTGELRATSGDTVTLAVDEQDAETLAGGEFRLVTLPVGARPEREFASLLRAADATMAAVRVAAGSRLVGLPIGALDLTVAAVKPASGSVEAIPRRSRVVTAGDTLYAIARPDAIRRLEGAATAPVDAVETAAGDTS